jgi:hypothetical protein
MKRLITLLALWPLSAQAYTNCANGSCWTDQTQGLGLVTGTPIVTGTVPPLCLIFLSKDQRTLNIGDVCAGIGIKTQLDDKGFTITMPGK